MYDKDGNVIGTLDKDGNIIEKDDGFTKGPNGLKIDKDGNVYDKDGNLVGKRDKDGNIIDKDGFIIGKDGIRRD